MGIINESSIAEYSSELLSSYLSVVTLNQRREEGMGGKRVEERGVEENGRVERGGECKNGRRDTSIAKPFGNK